MTVTSGVATGEAARAGAPGRQPKRKSLHAGEGRRGTLLVLPTIVALAVVIGYPIVRAIIMSFQKDAGLDPATGLFVTGGYAGFSNYTHWLLQRCGGVSCPPGTLGSQFWLSGFNTVFLTVITVAFELVLGMLFALVMNGSFRGRSLLRASVLVPWAIPTAVTAKLWAFMFTTAGVVNAILHRQVIWGSGEWTSRFAVAIADIWKTTPFMALLILAGLQIIPGEVYEAARVDGASAWQRFTMITLPLVRPALMVAVLFRTLDVLRIYDLPAIMFQGGGGSGNATTTLSILVVKQIRAGFNSAAALSTITFIFIFLVAFVFVKVLGANVIQTQQAQQKGKI